MYQLLTRSNCTRDGLLGSYFRLLIFEPHPFVDVIANILQIHLL